MNDGTSLFHKIFGNRGDTIVMLHGGPGQNMYGIGPDLEPLALNHVVEAQSGKVYYIENGRYDSLTGIVLGIASMGLIKVVTIFSCWLGVALFIFIRKAKNRATMHRLAIKN